MHLLRVRTRKRDVAIVLGLELKAAESERRKSPVGPAGRRAKMRTTLAQTAVN